MQVPRFMFRLPTAWRYKNAKFLLVNLALLNIPTSELHTYENHFGLWPCWRSPGCMPKFKMNAIFQGVILISGMPSQKQPKNEIFRLQMYHAKFWLPQVALFKLETLSHDVSTVLVWWEPPCKPNLSDQEWSIFELKLRHFKHPR